MARVIVKQLNDKRLSEMNCVFDDDKRLEKGSFFYSNAEYSTVVDLELGGSLSSILEQAFRLTNSVDQDWFENPDILVDENIAKGCRSTSIGDIIIVEHDAYVVIGAGFKYLDTSVKNIFSV